MNTTPKSADTPSAETDSATYQTQFEDILPDLASQPGADLDVESLREESCLAPEVEEQQTETRWVGVASGTLPDSAAASAAMDQIGSWLDTEGWNKQNEVTHPPEDGGDVRILLYGKDDLGVVATHRENGQPRLEILLTSSCTKHPADHRMLRSELDPEYGTNSQYYDDAAS